MVWKMAQRTKENVHILCRKCCQECSALEFILSIFVKHADFLRRYSTQFGGNFTILALYFNFSINVQLSFSFPSLIFCPFHLLIFLITFEFLHLWKFLQNGMYCCWKLVLIWPKLCFFNPFHIGFFISFFWFNDSIYYWISIWSHLVINLVFVRIIKRPLDLCKSNKLSTCQYPT